MCADDDDDGLYLFIQDFTFLLGSCDSRRIMRTVRTITQTEKKNMLGKSSTDRMNLSCQVNI